MYMNAFFSNCDKPFDICSNVQNATSFQHMARMMDSLILNDFPPYTFTKITTTHRPMRTNNGMSNASKLMTKSTANISTASSNINNNNVAATLGGGNGTRQNVVKAKVPTQGKMYYMHGNVCSDCIVLPYYNIIFTNHCCLIENHKLVGIGLFACFSV